MLYLFKYCQKISNLKRKWLQKIDGENFYVFYAASNDAFGLLAKFCEKKQKVQSTFAEENFLVVLVDNPTGLEA